MLRFSEACLTPAPLVQGILRFSEAGVLAIAEVKTVWKKLSSFHLSSFTL
jgi:hypothetical protein